MWGEVKEVCKCEWMIFSHWLLQGRRQKHPGLLSCESEINLHLGIENCMYLYLYHRQLPPVPIRVLLLPVPKVSTHSIQILRRLESKFCLS